MCDTERSNSTLLLPGLAGDTGGCSDARNCGSKVDRSETSVPLNKFESDTLWVFLVSGSSYRQKSTASLSDMRVRNLQATISQA